MIIRKIRFFLDCAYFIELLFFASNLLEILCLIFSIIITKEQSLKSFDRPLLLLKMAFEISNSLLQRIACLYDIDYRILKLEGGFDHFFYGYSMKKQDFLIRIKTDLILNKKSFIQ